MNIYSIYRVTNTINSNVYIGFTSVSMEDRARAHLKNSKTIKNKFYNAIRKHGWNYFSWETIYQSLDFEHTLNVMENYFINQHDSYKNGYNSTLGGEGTIGLIITEEQRQRRSEIANRVYQKMTTHVRKEKFGRVGSENGFFNKKHSEESLKLMSMSHDKQREKLLKCSKCGKEVDAQNYALHHGDKCGTGSGVRGRKWYHSVDKLSYYLLPTDSKISELNLVLGRITKNKLGRPKFK